MISGKNVLASNLKEYTRLSDKEIQQALSSVSIKRYKKGSILLLQGFAPRYSYYLLEGCIRQYVSDEDGKEATVNFFTEEESINMFSFLDKQGLSLYSLTCLEDCMLVECSDLGNDPADDDSPEISNMKRVFFEKQFSDMQINYTNFKLKSPEEKFLLLAKQRPKLMKRVPQVHLASYLGIAPETFSRFKKKFKI